MKPLHLKYRPKKLSDIVGQKAGVTVLKKMVKKKKVPHALLFTGPSGCGKTTLARIMAIKVNCSKVDFKEINTADFGGIAMVRDIRQNMRLATMGKGNSRVWLIDEAHQLSSAAQHAFLKILEEPPEDVYFFLATTEPAKLMKTIKTRTTLIKLTLLTDTEIAELLAKVCKAEKIKITEDVIDKITEYSEGSARQALVYLETVAFFENEKEQLSSIERPETVEQAIFIARELFKVSPDWKKCMKIIKELDDDIESLRWMILSYASTVIDSGGNQASKAFIVIDSFSEPFYDTGRAGLKAAIYRVIFGGS